MSEHLSALELDEVAAGLTPAPPHLAGCPACAARLATLRAQQAAFLERPEAKAQLARLTPPAPRLPLGWLAVVGAALAAAAILFFAFPGAEPETRIKGAPSLVLLDQSGASVTHAAPGQRLTLAVGSGGAAVVTLVTIDATGKREQLWSGPVDAGARVPVLELEVTPGDVTVEAEFQRRGVVERVSVHLAVP